MRVDEHRQHAKCLVGLDEAHSAHVGGEVEDVARSLQRLAAGIEIAQVQHSVVRLVKDLEPLVDGFHIDCPHSSTVLAEEIGDEMPADEASGAANDHVVHPLTSLRRCCRMFVPFRPSPCPPGTRIGSKRSPMVATSKFSSAYRRALPPNSSRRPPSARRRVAPATRLAFVTRLDEDSAPAPADDLGRKVVGGHRSKERTPRAEVAEHLRGYGERSGVRLEQREQYVAASQNVREDGVRLEGKQAKVEQALFVATSAEPVCSSTFGDDHDLDVLVLPEVASELHDRFRIVLEPKRPRVQNDPLADQVVFACPLVGPGPEWQLVDRRPILDHVDLVSWDPELFERRQEPIGDDRDCIAPQQKRALERYEAIADRGAEPSVAPFEDSPDADPK